MARSLDRDVQRQRRQVDKAWKARGSANARGLRANTKKHRTKTSAGPGGGSCALVALGALSLPLAGAVTAVLAWRGVL